MAVSAPCVSCGHRKGKHHPLRGCEAAERAYPCSCRSYVSSKVVRIEAKSQSSQPSYPSEGKGDIPTGDKAESWSAAPTPDNAGTRLTTTGFNAKSAGRSLKSNGREAARSVASAPEADTGGKA